MTERISRNLLVAGAVLAPLVLALCAYFRPGLFTSETYIGGILLLEFMAATLWFYRTAFFPVVIAIFLFAGTGVPGQGVWTAARWLFLAVGAWAGLLMLLKQRTLRFGLYHATACLAVFAAFISAAVSRYPSFAFLKALSLLLLFLYAATGVRLAVDGRERQFFAGLVNGCEIFVGLLTISYVIGREVMGNPNSLGAVMGVVCVPIMLWGSTLAESRFIQRRRLFLFCVSMYLVFLSHARAGIGAAIVSTAVLCLGVRRYKLLAQGVGFVVILVATAAILQPQTFSDTVSSATSSVMYKGKDPAEGIFGSRETPWQAAVKTIQAHFWFGTGFGTTDNGRDTSERLTDFSTEGGVSAENGSSFLAITTWVGMAGVLPFFLVVVILGLRSLRTVIWMFRNATSAHPAVPLAMVVIAGLVHAAFEDWLFAPGYYLCVFFWCMAFLLVDLTPSVSVLATAKSRRFTATTQPLSVATGR